ncbi:unnamed protein product [Kuraishia capsulata CBS 1993]|uniref:AB hydrolase-1 domain-containing protein n=1 Tax=Kuraishia capsulata CBS 1993 TaxID=1382522 RepID=W6MJ37_9ASCO|nr:uncharacterized protein KUCA_T00002471001 [Kuraishia capsulata CBS 1993]CDK26499.1 unnamed protein product [Kuraishia capsulata CBS 1993]
MGWNAYPTDPESKVIQTDLLIGGVKVFAFGLENVSLPKPGDTKKVAALFVLHGVQNNHLLTDSIAHLIVDGRLKQNADADYPLVAFAIDLPNHGERAVDLRYNGFAHPYYNIAVGSSIDAAAYDVKNILEFLPAYYPQFEFEPYSLGTSLGGLISFRLASLIPLKGIINIVGAPDLPGVLYNLVVQTAKEDVTPGTYKKKYEELELSEDLQKKYPKVLHDNLSLASKKYFEVANTIPLLDIYGELDFLVNSALSSEVIEKAGVPGYDVEVYSEPVDHTTTITMIEKVKEWLYKRLDAA